MAGRKGDFMTNVLTIENLSVSFPSATGEQKAVRGVSLTLAAGEVLALVGESGCGKSVLCKSIMKLLPEAARIRSGRILAGLLNEDRTCFADTRRCMYQELQKSRNLWSGNTTIGCVITNARLDKCQCRKAAVIAHDGYAQSIRPAHCTVDGDTLFVMASGQVEVAPDSFYAMASEAVARAVKQAALTAAPAYGLKAAVDFL